MLFKAQDEANVMQFYISNREVLRRAVRLAAAISLLIPATGWGTVHRRLGAHYTVTSTAYDACSSGSITASGAHTYWGEVANNMLPLGTRIRLDHPVNGRRDFRVMDRIGWGTQLDIWMPGCSAAIAYGRRTIGFRVIN